MKFDILHTFISPVTGRVLCPKDYVLVGDKFGVATPSAALIDLKLDLNNLRQHYNILRDASFVIGFPNSELENAQVLEDLDDGFMFNHEGIVEIKTTIDATSLTLTNKYVFVGDENNKAAMVPRVSLDNLPSFFTTNPLSLGGAYNLYTGSANPLKLGEPTTTLAIQRCNLPDLAVGKFWLGKAVTITEDPLNFGSNRPVEVDRLPIENMSDLLKGHFYLGDGNNRPQVTGLLYKNLVIGTQDNELGFRETIYHENLPALTKGRFWLGDGDNRPQDTGLLFKNLIIGTQDNELGFRETIYIDNLPELSKGRFWMGDGSNRPQDTGLLYKNIIIGNQDNELSFRETFYIENMPSLTKGLFWIGDGSNRPQETGLLYKNLIIGTQDNELGFRSTIYFENLPDVPKGHFITGDGDNRPQITGLLYKNLIIGTQDDELGYREKIYPENQVDLTFKKIRRGDGNNRPVESDDLTIAENKITQIEQTITEIQGQITEIQAEIAAIQAELVVIEGEITVIQGQITAIEAALAIIQGQIVTIFSAIAGLQLRLDNLRMEGFIESDPAVNNIFTTRRGPTCLLKNIPAGGDVDFGDYRIFNLATFSASTWTEMEQKAQDGINFLFLWQLFGGGVR